MSCIWTFKTVGNDGTWLTTLGFIIEVSVFWALITIVVWGLVVWSDVVLFNRDCTVFIDFLTCFPIVLKEVSINTLSTFKDWGTDVTIFNSTSLTYSFIVIPVITSRAFWTDIPLVSFLVFFIIKSFWLEFNQWIFTVRNLLSTRSLIFLRHDLRQSVWSSSTFSTKWFSCKLIIKAFWAIRNQSITFKT